MLTGDPANADPVCDKSPLHGVVTDAVEKAQRPDRDRSDVHPLVFRDPMQSRRLAPALSPGPSPAGAGEGRSSVASA
jgi:pyrroloquinoline quinone biosynthesis protein E